MANSLARIGYVALQDLAGWTQPAALGLATKSANGLFLVVAALLLLRTLDLPNLLRSRTTTRPTDDTMLWASLSAVVLAYLLIGSFWFQPWYVCWLLAPVALLPGSQLARILLPGYSLGLLWASLISDFFFYEIRTDWTRTNQTSLVVATMLLPLILAGMFSLWQQQRSIRADTAPKPATDE